VRKEAVFGIGPLFLALLAAACGSTSSHSTSQGSQTTAAHGATSSSTSSTTTGGGRATTTMSTGGPTSTVTEVADFSPWSTAGTVSSGLRLDSPVSAGSCSQSSAFDVGNPDAWRCTEPNGGFLDPCFAPPGRSGVTQVACGESPWSAYTVLSLSTPLADSSWGTPADNQSYPWAMVLANGQQCGLIEGTGTEIDGQSFNFACTVGVATYPTTVVQPWTASYAASSSGPATTVRVTTAWS
jgi:hypothetical protein